MSISTLQFLARLKEEIEKVGGKNEAAKKWGVHYQAIDSTLRCQRTPCKGILAGMKLRQVKTIRYR